MSDTPKILGQAQPSANSTTDLYTVPAVTNTVVSSVIITNTTATSQLFRLSIAQGGAADVTSQYLYYDVNLPGNDTFVASLGITLAASDKIRCRTNAANTVNFTAVGVELT